MNDLNFAIYNGCNHEIRLFSPADAAVGRDGRYFLRDTSAVPIHVFPQERPLNSRKNLQLLGGNIPFLEDVSQADTLEGFDRFDVVICSLVYATQACKTLGKFPDFLDRLFVLEPVYMHATDSETHRSTIVRCGSIGLVKFLRPKAPQTYVQELRQGAHPSVVAMRFCLQIFRACDYFTTSALNELRLRLDSLPQGGDHNESCSIEDYRNTGYFNDPC